MPNEALVREFVLSYLREIEAQVQHADGVYTATFPPGRKRRFGRDRRFTFDPAKRQAQVELIEAGSPFLKMLLLDAKGWGGLGAASTDAYPEGTFVFTFQFEAYSSVRKRSHFVHAVLEPDATAPRVLPGIPGFFQDIGGPVTAKAPQEERVKNLLPMALPVVESSARAFAEESVKESRESFAKSIERVVQYFQGMKHETFLQEARIRKRLGEIQSKLYFTEDGLRELKLQREQERLTKDLHELRLEKTQSERSLNEDQVGHVERQRRRHEPKLRVRLVAATLVQAPHRSPEPAAAAPQTPVGREPAPRPPPPEPLPPGGPVPRVGAL